MTDVADRLAALKDRASVPGKDAASDYLKTVCILCSANCGVEVKLDGREITRVRGNKAHLASEGYTCEKALRLNHYQNAKGRLTAPLKRMPDGTYVEVDWDTAISEVVAGFREVTEKYGSDKIMYYGGGGQGNHLVGAYGSSTRTALGIKLRSNALAQEKTGEAWVEGRMIGAHSHGDFHNAEVSIFLGKNPWHSHGFDQARRVLKEIKADDARSMIVIDPRRSETADMADFFLQVKPGTDAFCVAAILGTLVQEGLTANEWLAENTVGADEVMAELAKVDVADFAERCGVGEDLIRATARRIGRSDSVSIYEDLGIEMAPHSTLVSYLQRLIWVLVGSFSKPGATTTHSGMAPLFNYSTSGREPETPITGSAIISGLVQCNEIPELVLSDSPERIRAMFIESANPAHSLAGSADFREAMDALDFSVVIDVAMTETARHASYVLPAASQYEKAEATFFGAGFPDNVFTLRAPVLEPLGDSLPEAEIHARILRELGVYNDEDLAPLRSAAAKGRKEFAAAMVAAAAAKPELASVGAVILYETLGQTLPAGLEGAAVLWFSAQQCAMRYPAAVRAAGFDGADDEIGDQLFDAIIRERDGVIFTKHTYDQSWDMVKTPDKKINALIPELLEDLAGLSDEPIDYRTEEFPFILAAGERRSFTANTIMRDPAWRKKDAQGALRITTADAAAVGVEDGGRIRVTTPGGTAVAVVEVNDTLRDGFITLPNGMGLDYAPAGGDPEATGISPNELTTVDWKDKYAGTPWHKHVPAKLEAVAS